MFQIPIFISYLFAVFQLFLAKTLGVKPLITPKWVAKAKYHWKVSSKRAEDDLGYKITGLEDGLAKTVEALNR